MHTSLRQHTALAALVALAAASLPAGAAEFMPYSGERITAEQWQSYYDEVRTAFGETEKLLPGSKLVQYTDEAAIMRFTFTLPGNAAHPSWITRQLVDEGGRSHIEQVGYSAGDEARFTLLLDAFQDLTDQMNAAIEGGQ